MGYGLDKSPWAGADWANMGYVVAHFRKVKTHAGLGNVANHNSRANVMDATGGWIDRENLPPWLINPLQITENEGQVGRRDDSIQRSWHRVVQDADLKRKPQKNAAAAIEAVFSASPESFTENTEWKAYFADCREWVDKKFGHQNVLQWNTHFDEKTPHMHVLLVPIVRDPDLGNKYSSADFLGGREGLREIQTELYEKVGRQHKLERGVEGSKARHTDQAAWMAELTKKEKELGEREEELGKKEEQIKHVLKVPPAEAAEAIDLHQRFRSATPKHFQEIAEEMVKKNCATYGEFRDKRDREQKQEKQRKEKTIKHGYKR